MIKKILATVFGGALVVTVIAVSAVVLVLYDTVNMIDEVMSHGR